MNCTATNHVAHFLLIKTIVPVIKLKTPINAKWGVKLEKGNIKTKHAPEMM